MKGEGLGMSMEGMEWIGQGMQQSVGGVGVHLTT